MSEEPQILAQFDVRQFFTSSLACMLVNPRLGDLEQPSKLVNSEQSVKIPLMRGSCGAATIRLEMCSDFVLIGFIATLKPGAVQNCENSAYSARQSGKCGLNEKASRDFVRDRNSSPEERVKRVICWCGPNVLKDHARLAEKL